MMTDNPEKQATDRLDPELRKFFQSHPELNYGRLAEEMHILVEMVFGKNHSSLSSEERQRLRDLHDVIDHYKMRSEGGDMNMAKEVAENKESVVQVMETYKWVINEVRTRYSTSQLKYVGYLLDYMEHVQGVIAVFLNTLEEDK